eukprot:gene16810-19178_t
MAPDALVASRLNKSDGGKNVPFLRDGWYHDIQGDKIIQRMQTADGKQKGVERILLERGLWPKERLNLDCAKGCQTGSISCCARKLLSNQSDFLDQKGWLEEVVSRRSHQIIFYPKFHCELNFIEMVWGYLKAKLRYLCTFSFQDLCDNVPKLLDSIQPDLIIKFAQYCFRFMQGYRIGLHGPVLDYAMKKYKSHRRIPNSETYEKLRSEMKKRSDGNELKSHWAQEEQNLPSTLLYLGLLFHMHYSVSLRSAPADVKVLSTCPRAEADTTEIWDMTFIYPWTACVG